jgi:hypothetical protein
MDNGDALQSLLQGVFYFDLIIQVASCRSLSVTPPTGLFLWLYIGFFLGLPTFFRRGFNPSGNGHPASTQESISLVFQRLLAPICKGFGNRPFLTRACNVPMFN